MYEFEEQEPVLSKTKKVSMRCTLQGMLGGEGNHNEEEGVMRRRSFAGTSRFGMRKQLESGNESV